MAYRSTSVNATPSPIDESILIVGSGVFGLSTALALSLRSSTLPPNTPHPKITVVDRSPFPAPDAASIDSSRIVRADYKDPAYAALCARAQHAWRHGTGVWSGLGDEGRYSESGLVLVADRDAPGGAEYVTKSMENVSTILKGEGRDGEVVALKDKHEIRQHCKTMGGCSGDFGYYNPASGWADAEKAMRFLRMRCEERGDVTFETGEVVGLVEEVGDKDRGTKVVGVRLRDGREIRAGTTVLATGAWTGGLVDLTGRAVATGQVLAYVKLTPEEETRYRDMPVILNFSSGLFVLPAKNGILKVARHALGYVNTTTVTPVGSKTPIRVSVPRTAVTDPSLWIPSEAEQELRRGLRDMVPEFGDRPFYATRLCWYTDTPTADFIVDHVPRRKGLFVATGGSGHAFKFLPVLGEEVVKVLLGESSQFREKWKWREDVAEGLVMTLDGSRGGHKQEELGECLAAQQKAML